MDKLPSVTQSALQGLQEGRRRLEKAASYVAAGPAHGTKPTELTDPLVRALEAQRAFEASAKTLEHADRALQSLLDALV